MAPARRPAPIQAIVGEDSYLAEAALAQVLKDAVGSDQQESVRVLYGDEAKWEDVLSAARAGSLFAASRAVVVRRAELLKYASAPQDDEAPSDAKGRGKARSDEDPVDAYADAPAPDATLVLVAAKPDRRRRPWKSLLAKAVVHDAAPRKGRALRSHVEQELKRRGLRFTRDALDQLLEEVGQDLRRLMGEVDKLEAWADGRAEITSEDVASVLGRGLGQPLYLLSDAFAARDAPKSLELLERLLEDGEEGLRVLATLHRTLRQVRGAVAMREAGAPRPQIGARLLPPNMQFKLDALVEASRRWSERDLVRALDVMGRTDRGMKRGADAAVALTSAIVASCGGPSTSPRRAP
ncbi:MAG TPA: DNA polymerase III subunit delta [Vicinamibacteria bacterium]|nr:DNA polymerase III subunit delta [Vicinamibacteria bacterium]